MRRPRDRRRGTTPAEVLVVAAVVGLIVLVGLMAIPRSRETARLASCENNLAQIGKALASYDSAVGHLPVVPPPGGAGEAPLAVMLSSFGVANFQDLPEKPHVVAPIGASLAERRISGFLCPSDPFASRRNFPAPTSYRADAGPDVAGLRGPFGLGRTGSMAAAEAGAGRDFTAAFSERLLGSGTESPSPANDYRVVVGPVGSDCPTSADDSWRGDAGSSWAAPGFAMTLYNHAIPPNAAPSCVSVDGKTARMGASSGHARRVNVLMLGGSVRGFTPEVDPQVWLKFGGLTADDRRRPE